MSRTWCYGCWHMVDVCVYHVTYAWCLIAYTQMLPVLMACLSQYFPQARQCRSLCPQLRGTCDWGCSWSSPRCGDWCRVSSIPLSCTLSARTPPVRPASKLCARTDTCCGQAVVPCCGRGPQWLISALMFTEHDQSMDGLVGQGSGQCPLGTHG